MFFKKVSRNIFWKQAANFNKEICAFRLKIKRKFSGGKMKFKFITILCLAFALFLSACGGKSDADLQKAAETAAKAKAPTVTVAVKDGVATLTGEVATEQAKTDAATAAKVDGIKSVTNNITVKPTPPPITATTDTSMKPAIEAALKAKGFTEVTVDTSTTPATLRGTFPKGKLAEVIQTAQTANGGKPVKNEATEK
jgi:hypothetical protein